MVRPRMEQQPLLGANQITSEGELTVSTGRQSPMSIRQARWARRRRKVGKLWDSNSKRQERIKAKEKKQPAGIKKAPPILKTNEDAPKSAIKHADVDEELNQNFSQEFTGNPKRVQWSPIPLIKEHFVLEAQNYPLLPLDRSLIELEDDDTVSSESSDVSSVTNSFAPSSWEELGFLCAQMEQCTGKCANVGLKKKCAGRAKKCGGGSYPDMLREPKRSPPIDGYSGADEGWDLASF